MSSSKNVTVPAEASASRSLSELRPAITTNTLGNPGYRMHRLKGKLKRLAKKGFKGIELNYLDLAYYARANPNSNMIKYDIFKAAQTLSELCNKLDMTVITIQPFANFEGLVGDYSLFTMQFLNKALPEWVRLAYILRAEMILIPANYFGADKKGNPRTTSETIVSDLNVLVDRGSSLWTTLIQEDLEESSKEEAKGKGKGKGKGKAKRAPPTYTLKFVYEAQAWSDHIDTWQKSWEVVKLVDRPNFGMCLDTFNIAAKEYAEPSQFPRGVVQMGGEEKLRNSLNELSKLFKESPPEHQDKLFLVQVADGEKLRQPLVGDLESPLTGKRTLATHCFLTKQPTRMTWSQTGRLFPFIRNKVGVEIFEGCLPIADIIKVIFHDLNYRGWVSFEATHLVLTDESHGVPTLQTNKAWESWEKMLQKLAAMKLLD